MHGRVRGRLLVRAGMELPTLPTRSIAVAGLERRYALVTAAAPVGLIVALHGAGGTAPGTAALSGLHRRGPDAGFVVAFPEGVRQVWNDDRGEPRLQRRAGIDDVGFLSTIVAQETAAAGINPGAVFFVGISNGAFMSEYVARSGAIGVAGLGLVAGAGTERSRLASPLPSQAARVLLFSGTADPLVPYAGGAIGAMRLTSRNPGREAGRGVAVGAEAVAADWALANGVGGGPAVERVPGADLPVTRLTWGPSDRPAVTLHRIEGGGHTWPDGPAYLPPRIVGPVVHGLDATGLMLAAFEAPR